MVTAPSGSKADIVAEIASLLGVECPPMSSGSTEPKTIFVLINDRLGLGLEDGLTKPELAREIVRASGAGWDPDFESRGATVTKAGLMAVLLAVRFWVGSGTDDSSMEGRSEAALDTSAQSHDSSSDVARASFIEAVAVILDPRLQLLQFRRRGAVNTRRGGVFYRLPSTLEIARFIVARVVASGDFVDVGFYIEYYPDSDRNWQVAELLRGTYSSLLVTYGLRVDRWHGSGAEVKRDRIITRLNGGYNTGRPSKIADEAADVLARWRRLLTEHAITNVASQVEKSVGGRRL